METEVKTLLTKLAEKPLLLAPDGVENFAACLEGVVKHEHGEKMMQEMKPLHQMAVQSDHEFFGPDEWARPYVVVDGILQIPVMGALLNRFTRQIGTYATGYQYIERAFFRGVDDPQVKGIALVIDSNGGEAAGCFELVDKLYAARGTKPIKAFVADRAYSAAYAIASAADEIVVARSGGTGSVGVMTMHVSLAGALEQNGIEVTFIFAGKHKVDGNRFEPLKSDTKKRMQKQIDRLYGEFTETVARDRKMSDDAVRDTEALTYDAQESIDIGFADREGELEDEMIAFSEAVDLVKREDEMTGKTEQQTPPAGTFTQADVDTASASAASDARKAERARFTAVTSNAAYKGREALASKLLETDMTAEAIVAALDAAPAAAAPAPTKEAPKGGADQFVQHMNNDSHPNVEGTSAQTEEEDTPEAHAKRILQAYASAGGAVRKTAH